MQRIIQRCQKCTKILYPEDTFLPDMYKAEGVLIQCGTCDEVNIMPHEHFPEWKELKKEPVTWPDKIWLCSRCLYLLDGSERCQKGHQILRFWHNEMGTTICRHDYAECSDHDRAENTKGFWRGQTLWTDHELKRGKGK